MCEATDASKTRTPATPAVLMMSRKNWNDGPRHCCGPNVTTSEMIVAEQEQQLAQDTDAAEAESRREARAAAQEAEAKQEATAGRNQPQRVPI
jgi:hypothetical protein